MCILIPLIYRLPFLLPDKPVIALPLISEAYSVLFQYLVPEKMRYTEQNSLNPEIIKGLSLTSYTVKYGDSLSGIAQKFKLNLDTIISYNNIRDARALKAGTVLRLPNEKGLKYRVKRSDYLGGIAKRFGVPLNRLLDWNNLDSSLITPGQELFIPGARLSEHELNRVLGKLFIYPSPGRITSRFGMRNDPFTGVRRFHNGVDFANSVGTPVKSAMSGKVAMVGYNPNYGKYIILTHAEGFQTFYGHLETIQVRKGASVKQGQLIGKMGNSGYSTGIHLHFSIFYRGEPVDPFKYLH